MSQLRVDDDTLLVTADVSSLYTNIRHDLGYLAARYFIGKDDSIKESTRDFVLKLLKFAMEHNFFYYNGQYFLQRTGVAMGAKFAPSLANLFMALWENDHIFAWECPQLLFWRRFIDDAFFLWKGGAESLKFFMAKITSTKWGINFTYEYSITSVNFLDLTITKNEGRLLTKTFFKTTDRNGYIPIGSCHHPNWLKAIPKGQFQRVRRNCSWIEDYRDQAGVLKKRFEDKGYRSDILEDELVKIANIEREQLLKPKWKKYI